MRCRVWQLWQHSRGSLPHGCSRSQLWLRWLGVLLWCLELWRHCCSTLHWLHAATSWQRQRLQLRSSSMCLKSWHQRPCAAALTPLLRLLLRILRQAYTVCLLLLLLRLQQHLHLKAGGRLLQAAGYLLQLRQLHSKGNSIV